MKPSFAASTLFLCGLLLVGSSIHIWRGQKPASSLMQDAQAQTTIENSGGGTGAEITVKGTEGQSPAVGLETNGLKVIQTGPGTGMKVEVGGNGPAVGVRSTVGVPQK